KMNVDGTRNVLDSAIRMDVKKIVYLSTIAVHGPNLPDNANEKDEFRRFGTPYGDSKIAAEELVWSYWKEKHIPVTVIRPTFIWGPGSPHFTVWPIQLMKANRWFLIENGMGTCHANYIDNLVDAILLSGIKEEAIGEAFFVKDDAPCTWSDFFGYYAKMVGRNAFPSISSNSYKIYLARIARIYTNLFSSVLGKMKHTPTSEPARTFIRGMRFGLRLGQQPMRKFVLPFDSWDILKYSRIGRLDTSKIADLLGYQSRITREQGMKETEIWLRNQNII
ncbi:MAG: SDR family oxidoreductase, partial [Candidatus Subteraquimicrobiales bacterium]|nr:SDR family oxidoreductase [Candidatus Subteraquimicrobiales bacterium]